MNSVMINPKYRCENMYCHFLWDVDLPDVGCGLCLANDWNAFINSQNDFGFEEAGLLQLSSTTLCMLLVLEVDSTILSTMVL